jgi:hypothetical protein
MINLARQDQSRIGNQALFLLGLFLPSSIYPTQAFKQHLAHLRSTAVMDWGWE